MRRFAIALAAVLLAPGASPAAVSCPDRMPAAIMPVAATGRACQETIARESAKFLKAKMAKLSKCLLKASLGECPSAKDAAKLDQAAMKAAAKIAAACGDDAAQAGLSSSYASETDDAIISSCTLSQHNVIAKWVVANANGPTTEPFPGTGKDRAACVKELNKEAWKFVDKALKNANSCLKKQMKAGAAGDLAPVCVGQFSGGAFTPPTDSSTASRQAKLFAKTEAKIAKKCGGIVGQIETLFGCAGARTVADLQACIICSGWGSVLDALEQEYAETGTFVANGPGAFQAAVDAASSGDKLLIGSGTYAEEVVVSTDGLTLVGCGGATDDRPLVVPIASPVTGNGIQATSVNGLTIQSIAVFGQASDGLHIDLSNDLVFRDIKGDGNLTSSYEIFPRTCNNVLIELSEALKSDDAPLYVGQSSGIVVRYNVVRDSVSAIEIENSANAQVYGNDATRNTAGVLVFKDGSLPIQLSECHEVHHNLLDANNTPNFGSGTVAQVPAGTGILLVSADTTSVHHNFARQNDTFGFTLVDQIIADFGPPFSADQDPEDNFIWANVFTGNGGNPDFTFGADAVALGVIQPGTLGNCRFGNVFDPTNEVGFAALPSCASLPPPAFPGCPAPPVAN